MSAQIIQFPTQSKAETDPMQPILDHLERRRAERRSGAKPKSAAPRENPVKPRRRHTPPPPSGDALLDGARRSIAAMVNHQRSREDAAVSEWLTGSRFSRAWFIRNSDMGIRSGHFGEGSHEYREGIRLAGAPIPACEKDAALAMAIETLNVLGFMARYAGLGTRGACRSYDDRVKNLHEARAASALCALGATLGRLQEFGAVAIPRGAEKRERDRALRAIDDARDVPDRVED